MNHRRDAIALPRRREFLFTTAGIMLSGASVALLAGRPGLARAAGEDAVESDIRILNTALGAEREAVAAYRVGAESGLLSQGSPVGGGHLPGASPRARRSPREDHRPAWRHAAQPPSGYDFPTDKLASEADVLGFAADLERGAVSAYVGAIPVFGNRDLSAAAASILADEAMHWAVLRQALGLDPVPGAFFS
ncbi:MAG: ferritin-like domain-containing protein [Gammaproteobacteria bacterium]|nr:ferritin-like domain-containing protein [Gammaproteobacteria bacterium]